MNASTRSECLLDQWDVDFTDVLSGYVAGSFGAIYRTTDGADLWERQSPVTTDLFGIDAVTPSIAVAVGGEESPGSHLILRTIDGGTTWIPESTGPNRLHDVVMFDLEQGIAVGAAGTIMIRE